MKQLTPLEQQLVAGIDGDAMLQSTLAWAAVNSGTGNLAGLAQVADMERKRIMERTAAGREVARDSLARTGKTQHGKTSLGRPMAADAVEVKAWRDFNSASIAATAMQFGIGTATVKRYCKS